MSFSPQTGLVYIPVNDLMYAYIDRQEFKPSPISFNTGVDPTRTRMTQSDKATPSAPTRGYLRAWNPITQKEVWSVEHPGPWNGGVLSTEGGLVLQGNAVGLLNAYDARDGKLLWSSPAQTGIVAAPITYRVNDEQYIAVVAGWGGVYPNVAGEASRKGSLAVNRSRVLAFKLGASGKLPEPAPVAQVQPVARAGDDASAARGFRIFHDHCSRCHGAGAVGGGVIPDLRWSAFARDGEAWRSVVLGGSLKERGMVSFAAVLGDADAEALRAYVTQRSNQ
jgi:alcohol dehydrogenase (cytochrome c)/quinohemoprotein ethanol dehydrogenase